MTIRLYCDEDSMRHALIVALRKRGVDVTTALEAGMTVESDARQLEYAAKEQRAIYSFNVGDFCQLHSQWLAEGKSHSGIILARQQQFSIGEQLRRLIKLMNAVSSDTMLDRLEFLSQWG